MKAQTTIDPYQPIINNLLKAISTLYLTSCLPQVETRRNKEIVFTYRWTSEQAEQDYQQALSLLADYTQQQINFYRTKEKSL